MKFYSIFLFILLLASCKYFDVKKTSSEAILNNELKTFNWHAVDEYPSFIKCDSLSAKEDRKNCFQHILTNHVWGFLKNKNLVVTRDINDTLMLQFIVTKNGILELTDIEIDSTTKQEITNIKELLLKSLDSLPKIYPAIKRGQQVTTTFKLPVIINAE